MPPAKTVEISPEVQAIIDRKVAEALAVQNKALKKPAPKGWLIRSPIYGKVDDNGAPLVGKVPFDELMVHRHNVPDGKWPDGKEKLREVAGGSVQLVNGQGYTDNEDFANFIAQYWGPDGYKVTRVNADNSSAPVIAKTLELARIVDGVEQEELVAAG